MTHDSACCARASNISGLLHSNSYINHTLNLDCSEAARLHSHTIQFILWTMPLPPIFVYCVLSVLRQLYYRITHCVICMWHPLLMSVLRPQYRITTCISVIWFFMCHVDFTNFVIVCFEAAIQHYNMHHLCVKVFTNLDIVCYEAA